MDRFKNIFKREQPGPGGQSPSRPSNGTTLPNGQTDSDSQSDAEGFLCPTCMQSFSNPDLLQQHFSVAHADPPPTQVSADKELELLKMQLTASEESRSLLSSELINMQRQMQELAANQPEQSPDLAPEVKRLETQIQLMQIENTELAEKNQLADKSAQQLQENLTEAIHEQKNLQNSITTEKEKYSLINEQLTQEKQRNNTIQEEAKRLSEQLRKSEVSLEQLRLAAGKADEIVAKLSGKEELCRNLEQQINDNKQNFIKHESEIAQLKKALDTKEESLKRSSAAHNEMKTAMESKIHSMEELIQEKTTSLDRVLSDNEQLQHKTQTLEGRLNDNQTELVEANKKYDDLHQNFVQRIDAGEGTNVIVTQLKEDNARIQEKLKHSEEKLQTEKEDGYQKLKAAEAVHKELEQRLSAITAETGQLKASMSSLEKSKESMQSDYEQQLSSLKSEQATVVDDLRSTVNAQEEALLKLDADISSAGEDKEKLTISLQQSAEEVSSLQLHISGLQQTVSSLESSNSDLTQQVAEKTEELSTLTTRAETQGQQLTDKNKELGQLREQVEAATLSHQQLSSSNEQQVANLNERIGSLEVDLKSSEDLLQEKLSALDQLQEDSAVLNEQILEVKEKLASAESARTRLEEENVSMQTLVTNLEIAKLDMAREAERLQGLSDGSSTQLSLVSADLERAKQLTLERDASIVVLKQQLDTQTKEGESLQSSLLQQIDQMGAAAKQAETAKKADISKLQADIEDLHNKIKKQSETNTALSGEHAAVLDKLNTTEVQLGSLQTAYEASKAEVESLQKQMDKKSDDHSHVLQETTEILQRTSDENEALNRALTELKTEVSVVEEQLLNAQKNSDDWQSKHRLLQDDIEAVKQALQQEKTTSEETKQLLISNKLQMQNKYETLEEEKIKLEKEMAGIAAARDGAEQKAQDNLRILEGALAAEKSKMEEAEARFNMQLVSLTENLSLNKTDLTATQEKLMDVVKHNDELRGLNIELETKVEASNDERNMLWNRCITSENETKALRDEKEDLRSQIENLNSALHELGRENQSLQIKTTKAQARRWVEDDDVLDCTNCAKSFNVRVRKHHCRNCGNIFCHDCSSKTVQLPISSKPSRVCDNCHVELNR